MLPQMHDREESLDDDQWQISWLCRRPVQVEQFQRLLELAGKAVFLLPFRRFTRPTASVSDELARSVMDRNGDPSCHDSFRAIADAEVGNRLRGEAAFREVWVCSIKVFEAELEWFVLT